MHLGQLQKGQHARILTIDADQGVSQRLMAMGLLPDELVEVIQLAPLGDPITVVSNGNRISLRRADAATVLVATS